MCPLDLELDVSLHPRRSLESRDVIFTQTTAPTITESDTRTWSDVVREALLDILKPRIRHYIHRMWTTVDQYRLLYHLIDD